MVSGAARQKSPRSQMRHPQHWPKGRLRVDGEPTALVVQEIAARLTTAFDVAGNPSIREVSRASGVNHQTIGSLLEGTSWPDVMTIVRLEMHFGSALWPTGNMPILVQNGILLTE